MNKNKIAIASNSFTTSAFRLKFGGLWTMWTFDFRHHRFRSVCRSHLVLCRPSRHFRSTSKFMAKFCFGFFDFVRNEIDWTIDDASSIDAERDGPYIAHCNFYVNFLLFAHWTVTRWHDYENATAANQVLTPPTMKMKTQNVLRFVVVVAVFFFGYFRLHVCRRYCDEGKVTMINRE